MIKLLDKNVFCTPTPKGVFHFIQQSSDTLYAQLMSFLFSVNQTIPLNIESLQKKFSQEADSILSLLENAEKNNWLTAERASTSITHLALDDLIKELSVEGNVLLTDYQGFNLGDTDISTAQSALLSAMSSEISESFEKYNRLTKRYPTTSPGWGMVDMHGRALISVWKMDIAGNHFYLLIEGQPKLANSAFVKLVWLLHYRYHKR